MPRLTAGLGQSSNKWEGGILKWILRQSLNGYGEKIVDGLIQFFSALPGLDALGFPSVKEKV